MNKPPIIEPIEGEPLRFRCESHTEGQSDYIVDLADWGGNGSCVCADFSIRKLKKLKEGYPFHSNWTECKHIKAAKELWAQRSLSNLAKLLENPQTFENYKILISNLLQND
jgi:hypothetical protein